MLITASRTIAPAFLLIALALALAGCSRDGFNKGKFVSREHGFSVTLPDGWVQGKIQHGNAVTFYFRPSDSDAAHDQAAIAVTVMKLPKGTGLAEFEKVYRSLFPKLGFKEMEAKALALDGVPGSRIYFTHTLPDGAKRPDILLNQMGPVRFQSLLYLAVKGDKGYAMGAEAIEQTFPGFRGDFERSAGSLSLK